VFFTNQLAAAEKRRADAEAELAALKAEIEAAAES